MSIFHKWNTHKNILKNYLILFVCKTVYKTVIVEHRLKLVERVDATYLGEALEYRVWRRHRCSRRGMNRSGCGWRRCRWRRGRTCRDRGRDTCCWCRPCSWGSRSWPDTRAGSPRKGCLGTLAGIRKQRMSSPHDSVRWLRRGMGNKDQGG